MPVQTNLKIVGLDELKAKCDFDKTVLPALQVELRDKILARWQRKRRTLGARNNMVTAKVEPLRATLTTTRRWPRTKGTSWQNSLLAAGRAMAPRLIRSSVKKRVEAAWSA